MNEGRPSTRVRRLFDRGWQYVFGRIQFRGCVIGPRVQVTGRVIVQGRPNIAIGDRSKFLGGLRPTRLIAGPSGALHVGSRCVINYGAYVEAQECVVIGSDCLFGSAVHVSDVWEGSHAPVIIEDHVWLAHGAQVRPGVRIGRGAVVAAGTVVSADVPPETLAVGEPPRFLPLGLVSNPADAEHR